jgi:hypothetical protein
MAVGLSNPLASGSSVKPFGRDAANDGEPRHLSGALIRYAENKNNINEIK